MNYDTLYNAKEEIFKSLQFYCQEKKKDIEFIREISDIHCSICVELSRNIVNNLKLKEKKRYTIDNLI